MFGWRRRSEGIEWREYVRTTVLVRRADRQRRLDDARMAALEKVKDTRDRGVAAAHAGVETFANHMLALATAAGRVVWQAASVIAGSLWNATCSAAAALEKRFPDMRLPLEWPLASRSADGVKKIAKMLPDVGFRVPFDRRMIGGGALALALIFIGGPMLRPSDGTTGARMVPTIAAPGSTTALSGRANAASGDMLRIDEHVIRLAGIESPEPNQSCLKSNGHRWNCGTSARAALEKMVRGKNVICMPSAQDSEGRIIASCRINDVDVAETLVHGGHVFAETGLLASYGSAQTEARSAAIGLWQGEAVRPSEWRAQVWDEAKKAAPEGCPIKGYIRASDRIYAMPWSHGYDGAKVRSVRGDRWFCSEDEARAAGFRLSDRS